MTHIEDFLDTHHVYSSHAGQFLYLVNQTTEDNPCSDAVQIVQCLTTTKTLAGVSLDTHREACIKLKEELSKCIDSLTTLIGVQPTPVPVTEEQVDDTPPQNDMVLRGYKQTTLKSKDLDIATILNRLVSTNPNDTVITHTTNWRRVDLHLTSILCKWGMPQPFQIGNNDVLGWYLPDRDGVKWVVLLYLNLAQEIAISRTMFNLETNDFSKPCHLDEILDENLHSIKENDHE